MKSILRLLMAFFVFATLPMLLVPSMAMADFPEKPIKIVIPWAAGSGPDSVLRILAEMMRKDVGEPIIVTNVVGGSGTKGLASVKNGRADGYTLINNWVAPHTVAPLFNPNVGYDANNDFEPVAGFIFLPFTLMVKSDHPANSLKEFVDWAKAQDRELKFGACAQFSVPRMVMEEFTRLAGIKATPVPYPGCMPDNVKSLMDGSTDYTTGVLQAIKVFGKFTKTLAILTDERNPLAPDIPTAKEQGYDIGWGKVGMGWGGLSVKAGTPKDRLKKLQDLFGKWIQNKEFIQRCAEINIPITYTPPEKFYQLWLKSQKVLTPAVERIKKGSN